ncbi:helix-turn-helix transcriptional regulator [Orbaceae bacterium ac157xtp]
MTISSPKDRIKEERKKLKLTQSAIADLFGIQRETWSRYEAGTISPGMDVLIAFSKIGADIQYILTGERQSGLILNREEKELIELYRNAPLAIKAATLGALTAGTAQQSGINISNNTVHDGQVAGGSIYNLSQGKLRK